MVRKRLSILCLAFMLATSLVGAETVQMGFMSVTFDGITSNFANQIFTSISQFVTEIPSSPQYLQRIGERKGKHEELTRLEKQHTVIKNSDGNVPQIESGPSFPSKEESQLLAVSWKSISTSPALRKKALSGDEIVLNYLVDLHRLDGLLICSIDRFDAFYRVRIIFHNPNREVLYDGLTKPEELAQLKGDVFLAVSAALTDQELGLLYLTTPIPGTALFIDEQQRPSYDNFIPIQAGSYTISMVAPGFIKTEQDIGVDAGEIVALDLSMNRVEGPPLLITSSTHEPVVTIPHGPSGRTPLIWQAQTNPFVLYAYQEGMRPTIRQFYKPIEHIELTLQPTWMTGTKMIARSQKHVYASLGRTLILGAVTILVDSLSRSFSSNHLWQPMVWGTLGAMTLSSLETGVQLFAYYQKTKYSSQ